MSRVLSMVCAFFAATSLLAQTPMRSSAPNFSIEAKLDALAKKLDEQNTKIDLLSQQILKLQQQQSGGGGSSSGNARPGVMIGESTSSPSEPANATSTSSTATSPSPPPGNTHIVARGETLTSIAKAYNVSITELQRYNHIENPLKLQAGQTLVIPPSPASSPGTGE